MTSLQEVISKKCPPTNGRGLDLGVGHLTTRDAILSRASHRTSMLLTSGEWRGWRKHVSKEMLRFRSLRVKKIYNLQLKPVEFSGFDAGK